jgi:hypothetical protein
MDFLNELLYFVLIMLIIYLILFLLLIFIELILKVKNRIVNGLRLFGLLIDLIGLYLRSFITMGYRSSFGLLFDR